MPRPTRVSRYLALGLVVLGVMLMIMKIIADSEPGAIPLLLILVGTAGYLLARKGQSSQD